MFDREGGIGRDSRGHRLNESERRRRKKETDGGCLEGVFEVFFFFILVDVGLDEAGKTEASSLLLADAADRRNAGLPRLLCLFVELKDSRSAVKHTVTLGSVVTVIHSLSTVILASLKSLSVW